ncbi:hypothetical protein PGIGA_G00138290, partial [Pangasianodon gigas]|nr:hypothetical protein [Pangasianodon gigas]
MDHCNPDQPAGSPQLKNRATQINGSDSPGPSCVSMKSDRSKDFPPMFKEKRESSSGY